MARYIKANPKVAKYLHLEDTRNQLHDGNYLLWQADMLELGSLTHLPDILDQIGGIALTSHEARQEQDGTILRPLPTATDPRFIYEPPFTPQNGTEPSNALETGDNAQEGHEVTQQTESPAEGAESAGECENQEEAGDGSYAELENNVEE